MFVPIFKCYSFQTFELTIIALGLFQIFPPVLLRSYDTMYHAELNKNHTESLFWILNGNEKHSLNCTLAEGVKAEFRWTHGDGTEINATNIIPMNGEGFSALEFVNISYHDTDTYQCKATAHIKSGNISYTYFNATNVNLYVQQPQMLGLLIGMSVAAGVFFIIAIVLIKFL